MADDRKRAHNVCAKITDRMLIDVNRLAIVDDISISAWLSRLIRRELYGRLDREPEATSEADSDEGIPRDGSRG